MSCRKHSDVGPNNHSIPPITRPHDSPILRSEPLCKRFSSPIRISLLNHGTLSPRPHWQQNPAEAPKHRGTFFSKSATYFSTTSAATAMNLESLALISIVLGSPIGIVPLKSMSCCCAWQLDASVASGPALGSI